MQIKAAVLESIDNVLIKSIYSRKLFPWTGTNKNLI